MKSSGPVPTRKKSVEMGDITQSYGSCSSPESLPSGSLNHRSDDTACPQDTSPLLVGNGTGLKQRRKPAQHAQSPSKARKWVKGVWTRLTSRDGTSASSVLPTTTAGSSLECECGVPESEPLFRRLRRMNSRMDKSKPAPPVSPLDEFHALRNRLSYHFSDFHSKYTNHKKKPWKFVLQILKIILVSVQISLFAKSKESVVDFLGDNRKTMDYMFVSGRTDLYTIDSVHEHLNSIVEKYYNIQHQSTGAYDYTWSNGSIPPVDVCITYYKVGRIFAFNQSYEWNQDKIVECTLVGNDSESASWITTTFTSTNFDRIYQVDTQLQFRTLFLNGYGEPLCVALNVSVIMDNSNHAGRIPISLVMLSTFLKCHGDTVKTLSDLDFGVGMGLDFFMIAISLVATILTLRSLVKTGILARRVSKFLQKYSQHHLTWKEILRLFDFWHINAVIADSLVITGTMLKLAVELQGDVATRNESQHYNLCSFLLGVGCLLIWVGALRFLSYFHGYNVLLVTLRCALPNLLRFMLCSGILYMAFCFCGWVALGTFHIKFKSLTVTSETLFSLLNGDDMFRTFELMPTSPVGPYIFSQIYLYIFISLFIYFVLSQFIALITETYTEVLNMKPEDFEHLNACGHILQLLDVSFDESRPPSLRGSAPSSPTSTHAPSPMNPDASPFERPPTSLPATVAMAPIPPSALKGNGSARHAGHCSVPIPTNNGLAESCRGHVASTSLSNSLPQRPGAEPRPGTSVPARTQSNTQSNPRPLERNVHDLTNLPQQK